jgi:hypothetical protein
VVIQPPSSAMHTACDLLDHAVGRFLAARECLQFGRYEADVEASLLFNLVLRHVESVISLARTDLTLLPAAYSVARSAFETATKAAWLVDATDPYVREGRWLAHVAEEERVYERAAERFDSPESKARFHARASRLREFRTGVQALMPKHVPIPKGNPSLEEACRSIGGEHLYSLYIYLSQFVHGGHCATSLYRQGLGTEKQIGEFITEGHWYIALRICWLSLSHPATVVLSRISGTEFEYLNPAEYAKIEAAIEAIKSPSPITLH